MSGPYLLCPPVMAMNTFISPITGFSLMNLVFHKETTQSPKSLIRAIGTVAKDFREYCIKMRARLEEISTVVMEMKALQQQRQAEFAAQQPEPFTGIPGRSISLFPSPICCISSYKNT